jgi:glycosyltransferase involved in cell wall biosynthesis
LDKIIFITPFFGNSGSEIALFNLITRIKGLDVIVISRKRGALADRLPGHIQFHDYQTFCKDHRKRILLIRLRNKILRSGNSTISYFLDYVVDQHKALFYVNTLVMPEVVDYLHRNKHKFVVHSHELQQKLLKLKNSDVLNIVDGADFVFASSKACKDVLVTLGRHKDIVHSYPGVDIKTIVPKLSNAEVRTALKIPADSFVITMSGAIDTNKDPEAFLEIGKILKDRAHSVHLLWIGVSREDGYYYFLKRKTKEYNLEGNCSWIMAMDRQSYFDHLNVSDCFVLTSRLESFSIALVEALALGKPVFSFKSGGPQEIINDKKIGLLIDDHSPQKMAAAVEKLILREITFNTEMAQARARDFSADEIFRNWFSELKERFF